jgi:hypothetical protein
VNSTASRPRCSSAGATPTRSAVELLFLCCWKKWVWAKLASRLIARVDERTEPSAPTTVTTTNASSVNMPSRRMFSRIFGFAECSQLCLSCIVIWSIWAIDRVTYC